MKATVQKWGNSLAIRIPKSFAEEAHVGHGSSVDLSVKEGDLVIHPLAQKQKLEDLLSQITPLNIHSELEFGQVGKELF